MHSTNTDMFNEAKGIYGDLLYLDEETDGCGMGCGTLLAIILCILLTILLGSCSTPQYIAVPEVHEIHHHHTDSIHETDSVTVERETVVMQLDSAAMAQYGIHMKEWERAWLVRTRELERELQRISKLKADTVTVRDSIPYPVEVPVEVPAQLTWWQQVRLHLANVVLWVLLICGGIWLWKKKNTFP